MSEQAKKHAMDQAVIRAKYWLKDHGIPENEKWSTDQLAGLLIEFCRDTRALLESEPVLKRKGE